MRRGGITLAVLLVAGCSVIVPGPDEFTYGEDDAGTGVDAGPGVDGGPDDDAGADDDGGADAGPGCAVGEMFCGGGCVDPQVDVDHCGECGNACDDGWVCRDGACSDPVVQVSVGFHHSCARTQSRRLFCWGSNEAGQLGDGSFSDSLEPVEVEITDVVDLDSYGRFFTSFMGLSCAVVGSGEVHCWGMNNARQLGDGTTDPRNRPAAVAGVATIADVTTADEFACAARSSGTVVCWGTWLGAAHDVETLPGLSTAGGVLDAGLAHACATTDARGVVCWGSNSVGQLGDASRPDQWAAGVVPGVTDVTDLAAGAAHACALTSAGDVHCWGAADALGIGASSGDATPPTHVSSLADVTSISAGLTTTCAIHGSAHDVSCWAATGFEASSTPRQVAGLSNVVSVAIGSNHACAALADGSVVCWGANTNGQLGDGTTDDHVAPAPVLGLP